MLRFDSFERLGLRVAAISDRSDGDCSCQDSSFFHRKRFLKGCGISPTNIACCQQVHDTNICVVKSQDCKKSATSIDRPLTKADGIITQLLGVPLCISIADCAPVFLFAPTVGVAALLHAGRKGTLKDICGAGVRRFEQEFSTKPTEIHALIGPSAGPCCYKVSAEIATIFSAAGLTARGCYLDLWASNRQRLESAGIPRGQITLTRCCTICDDTFHSYRRDGTTSRNLALIML